MTAASLDLWLTPQQMVDLALPGLPDSKRSINLLAERRNWAELGAARRRGAGYEYHISVLPLEAQRALTAMQAPDLRLQAVERVEEYCALGQSKSTAAREAAVSCGVSVASVWRWLALVEGVSDPQKRLELLRPAEAPEAVRGAMEAVSSSAKAQAEREAAMAAFEGLPERAKLVAEARLDVVRAVEKLAAATGLSITKAREVFVSGWLDGDSGLSGETLKHAAKLSVPTIKRWTQMFERGGLGALAPRHGGKRGSAIDRDADVQTLIAGMMVTHPDASSKLVMRALRARFSGVELPSYRTVQRYVADWKAQNAALYLMTSSPDGYRSKGRLVIGRADEDVLRLNQRWEMDSTPNDVILKDGERHALIGVIDVYSRRARLLVARTSSSAGVAACLRRAILDWGVPEVLKCDNGSDYASKHIARVAAGIGFEQDFCPPFQPEKKPHIERFFRTFSHDLVTLLGGFIGHNVEQRKRIEDRKAFSKRIMDKAADPLELRLTADELQDFCDRWCMDIYEREARGGLGTTPFQKAMSWTGPIRTIENERALDMLLMPAPGDGGTRIVTKKGLAVDGAHYSDPVLIHHLKKRVQVRIDEADWGRVLVLSEVGAFITWAICPERAGVSRAEVAAHFRAKGREIEAELSKTARRLKRESRADTVADDILGQARKERGTVLNFPKVTVQHENDALGEAAKAAKERGKPKLVEKRKDVSEAEVRALDDARPAERREGPEDRFLRWEAVDARVRGGAPVDDAQARFWRSYAQGSEHASIAGMVEEFGRVAVLGAAEKRAADRSA